MADKITRAQALEAMRVIKQACGEAADGDCGNCAVPNEWCYGLGQGKGDAPIDINIPEE